MDDNTDNQEGATVTFFVDNEAMLNVSCELAATPEDRAKGLMYRETLADYAGMLFVYETEENICFWMKNTYIPLDIIFIDENSTVINIEEAVVQKDVSDEELIRYCSERPAKWVLEINQGLCRFFGITTGVKVTIEY